jgi:hypothetical protein
MAIKGVYRFQDKQSLVAYLPGPMEAASAVNLRGNDHVA